MMIRFRAKYIQIFIVGFTLATLFAGCEIQDIEVPEIEFFIAKEWKIQEAYRDGVLLTNETMGPGETLEAYRLNLYEDFSFDKINALEQLEQGNWALTSGLTQLVLFADQPVAEHWLIVDLKIRSLELRHLPAGPDKDNRDVRLILVPVKGQ